MKAYCINLDRRPDRLAHMTRQAEALDLVFERVCAVDGRDPEVAAAAARCGVGLTGLRMSAGAYGCFQSHREVWRRLLASGEGHAMVFEDDLVLAPGIADYLDPAWVPADADLVRLETFLTRFHRDRGPGIAVAGRHIHRMRSRHVGAGSYAISAGAAARLLAASERIDDPIDELLFNEASALFGGLVVYQMIPAPVVQGDRLAPDREKAESGWQATSITERYAEGDLAAQVAPEGTIRRLFRRMREESRSLAAGTRYVVAPYG